HVAENALVDARRIREAVAHYPLAALERGPDRLAHVIVAGGSKQDRLGMRAERLCGAGEKHVPHRLGAGRTARLARCHDGEAQGGRALDQARPLGRLAAPLPAFEGDEPAAGQSFCTPARNRLITSSVAASNARWGRLPRPTASLASSGTSSTTCSPRQT